MYTSASADKYICKAHFTCSWTEKVAPRQGILGKKDKKNPSRHLHTNILLYVAFSNKHLHRLQPQEKLWDKSEFTSFQGALSPNSFCLFQHNWDFHSISHSSVWISPLPKQDVNSVDKELQQVRENKTMLFSTTVQISAKISCQVYENNKEKASL